MVRVVSGTDTVAPEAIMFLVAGGWAFVALIYFKLAVDFASRDLSIVAAILVGLTFGGFVLVASGIYAMRLLSFNSDRHRHGAVLGSSAKSQIWGVTK